MRADKYIRNVNISKLIDTEIEEPYGSFNKHIEHIVANMKKHMTDDGIIYEYNYNALSIFRSFDGKDFRVFNIHLDMKLNYYDISYINIRKIFEYHIC